MSLLNVKTLREASYEGIRFDVDSATLSFGRRTVTHEFPQRDTSYVEDLGKATRQFSIQGFIVGDDFIDRSKRLIDKVESQVGTDRRANHGKLVHPWLGSLDVTPIDSPSITYDRAKRFCTFTLTFLEAGNESTKKTTSWANKLLSKADALYAKIFGDWTPDKIAGIVDDVTSQINSCAAVLSNCQFAQMFNLGNDILEMGHDIATSLYNKKEQARSSLLGALGLSQYAQSTTDWKLASIKCTDAITLPVLKPVNVASSTGTSKKLSDKERINEAVDEIKKNFRLVLIANAMGAISMIGEDNDVDTDSNSKKTLSDEQILNIRNNLLDAIDAEMLIQGTDDNQDYLDLVDSYVAVYKYLTEMLNGDSGIETVTLKQSEPSFVLAYDKYGDSTRADEIAERNDVINPLFMPVGDFTVSRK
jgi:prophage DNA circulation protein|nr:MAG TPA: DNA circularization protein [Caudoviricetes sp.]